MPARRMQDSVEPYRHRQRRGAIRMRGPELRQGSAAERIDEIRRDLRKYLQAQTNKRPLILPVILEV